MAVASPETPPFPHGFDVAEQDFRRDPFPVYARLRAEGGVHQIAPDMVMFSRYENVMSGIREPTIGRDVERWPPEWVAGQEDSRIFELLKNMMTHTEVDYHNRVRRLMMKAFTPGAIRRMQPRVDS